MEQKSTEGQRKESQEGTQAKIFSRKSWKEPSQSAASENPKPERKSKPERSDRAAGESTFRKREGHSGDRSEAPRKRSFDSREGGEAPRKREFNSGDRSDAPRKRSFDSREGGEAPRKREFNSGDRSEFPRKRSFDSREGGETPRKREFNSGERSEFPRKRSFDSREGGDAPRKRGFDSGERSEFPRKRSFDSREGGDAPRKRGFDSGERRPDRRSSERDGKSRTGHTGDNKPFSKFRSEKSEGSGSYGERKTGRTGDRTYDRRETEGKRSYNTRDSRDNRDSRGTRDSRDSRPGSDSRGRREEPTSRPWRAKPPQESVDYKRNKIAEERSTREGEKPGYKLVSRKFTDDKFEGKKPYGTPRLEAMPKTAGRRDEREGKGPKIRPTKVRPDDAKELRLNQYLAHCGIASRREADAIIKSGEVSVNGETITTLGMKVVNGVDDVRWKGLRVVPQDLIYILLNKPKNTITTLDDPEGRKTVLDIIKGASRGQRVYPVGRLDRNTTGLLLLTNDGELADKLMHPSHKIRKLYHARLDKDVSEEHMDMLKKGIELEDGLAQADKISYVEGQGANEVGIEVHIGRNRIVRRMFEALGYEVKYLDRVGFAHLSKKELPRGHWRYLTDKEVNFLKMN